MKKALIGMIAGAAALGGAVVPASGAYNDNLWDKIDAATAGDDANPLGLSLFQDLMNITDLPALIDSCGTKVTKYTVFAPINGYLSEVLDALGESVSSLSAKKAVVKALLSDHIHEGDIGYDDWADATIKNFKAISGATLNVTYEYPYNLDGPYDQDNEPNNVAINGTWIQDLTDVGDYQACNGWLYPLLGYIDTSSQPGSTGLQQDTSVTGSVAGGTSSLPNTL